MNKSDFLMDNENKDENEINLNLLLNFFLRNKKIIGFLTLSTCIFSILLSFIIKKTWEGQFQIVLTNSESIGFDFGKLTSQVTQIAGLNKRPNNLKTEIGILESPSILMPIFEIVKSEKNLNSKQKLIFSE